MELWVRRVQSRQTDSGVLAANNGRTHSKAARVMLESSKVSSMSSPRHSSSLSAGLLLPCARGGASSEKPPMNNDLKKPSVNQTKHPNTSDSPAWIRTIL